MTYHITIISPSDTREVMQDKAPTLKQLQDWVQGPIQQVPCFTRLGDRTGVAWANEEGRLKNVPVMNPTATGWWVCNLYQIDSGPLSYVPVLMGTVVFVSKVRKKS